MRSTKTSRYVTLVISSHTVDSFVYQRVYRDTFVLFCEPLGGHWFGGVWDPSLKAPRPFRVLGGFSSTPTAAQDMEKSKDKDRSMVVLNENAVLHEIERMGKGMVRQIIVHV